MEVGLSEATGFGPAPVSWASLVAWATLVGARLAPWEAKAIRGASEAFVGEHVRSSGNVVQPPWESREAQRRRALRQAEARRSAHMKARGVG